MEQNHYCYILLNESCTHTYVGYTVNPAHRIRQHNGEICGGAQRTKRTTPGKWRMAFIFECEQFDNHLALSFEWHLKEHKKKQRRSKNIDVIQRRMKMVVAALKNPKFSHCEITVYCIPELVSYLVEVEPIKNVLSVKPIDMILDQFTKHK
jgi:predicted GIY-YIG superfamily endonuclease